MTQRFPSGTLLFYLKFKKQVKNLDKKILVSVFVFISFTCDVLNFIKNYSSIYIVYFRDNEKVSPDTTTETPSGFLKYSVDDTFFLWTSC